jgi:hypothetical protein
MTRHLDPITRKNSGERRKSFYTYATVPSGISVSLTLHTSNIDRIVPADIEIEFSAPGREEELEAWKDVFGIEERYKAKCCGKNDGKYSDAGARRVPERQNDFTRNSEED